MVGSYTAVCIQANRTCIDHRSEIRKATLERALQLIDFAVPRFSFPSYAPTKLIVFPEVFLQGWCFSAGNYSSAYDKLAKDIAIEIPGEETRSLGEKAKEWNVHIAGSAMETDQEIGLMALNCAFIIAPNGEVIYKHHKYMPAISHATTGAVSHPSDGISPHDVYDKYLEVMDGKYGRKKGDVLSCLFPVIETDIGKLGYIICHEGFYPESARALAVQGCEVMLRSSGNVLPWGPPPYDSWELQNRSAAQFNLMYVVGCSPGDMTNKWYPTRFFPGRSMIVDPNGAVVGLADYEGETAIGAFIDIENLRRRRADYTRNYIALLRTEGFREIYAKPIYPKNLFAERLPGSAKDRTSAEPISRLYEEGIFIPPGN